MSSEITASMQRTCVILPHRLQNTFSKDSSNGLFRHRKNHYWKKISETSREAAISKITATVCNESDLSGIYIAGMFKKLTYILGILFCTMTVSCTKESGCMLVGEGTVIISGIVSDQNTGALLKDATITYESYDLRGKMIQTKKSYSSSNGTYVIEANGYTSKITCTLTASVTDGSYSESQIELNVDWNGSMFNAETDTFVVNDCNFHLQKSAK